MRTRFSSSRTSPWRLAVALASLGAATDRCQAQTYIWNNASGGPYATAGNWIPNGVPDAAGETAQFNLNATYIVPMAADTTVSGLLVRRGDVTLGLGTPGPLGSFQRHLYSTDALTVSSNTLATGGTLRLANGDMAVASNTILGGEFGIGLSTLSLSNARLTSGALSIGASLDAPGRLAIGDTSTLTVAGATVLGGAGDAAFELKAGSTSSFIGPSFPSQGAATHSGVVMAQGPTSDATATIHGIWNTGDLVVGDAGRANLDVLATEIHLPNGLYASSAGRLSSGVASIAAQPGSAGTVRVTGLAFPGAVSNWTIASSLSVGGTSAAAGGVGELIIGGANTVSVGGGLKLWPGATLTRGESSQFAITGAASLGGALEYTLNQFTNPQLGNEYPVLSAAGGVTGAFAASVLPPLAGGLRWVLDYRPTSVALVVASPLSADFNDDGDVDAADLAKWRGDFATNAQSDADGDGDSDGADFIAWQGQIGSGTATSAAVAVAEPGTAALAAWLLAVGCYAGHRRLFAA